MTSNYQSEVDRLEAELFDDPDDDRQEIDAAIVHERKIHAPPDDDLSELNEILDDAMAAKAAAASLQVKYGRLKRLSGSHHPDHLAEKQALIAAIRRLEEGIVWITTSNVALIQTQHCMTCGTEHQFFLGWWTEQQHKTDSTARRLVKGHTIENIGEKVERHPIEPVECCAACIEAVISINAAASGRLQ